MRKKLLCLTLAGLFAATGLMGQNKRVLYLSRLGPEGLKRIQAAVPNITLIQGDRSKLAEQLADVDGVIGSPDPAVALASPRLKWVQIESAGVERYTFNPAFVKSPITLTNCKILQGPEIAEHALGMLLLLTRQLNLALKLQAEETWEKSSYAPIELFGKTAVVVGAGGIGTQIAIRAHACGMTVIGVDPKDFPYMPFFSRTVAPDRLDEVLPAADVVFLAAPLTRASQGMMGPKQFGLMKQNSYFIAVSRGRIYDVGSLLKALETKRLAGAGVDVTDPEPLPRGHPLWKMPNVIITPHYAGVSDPYPLGEHGRNEKLYIENLKRFAAGERLLNIVDKGEGY